MLLLGVVQAQVTGDVSFGSYDLLQTEILTSSAASVTFSSLGDYAADYQHLQIRATVRSSNAANQIIGLFTRINGVTTNSYAWHWLYGNGGSVVSQAFSTTNRMIGGMTPDNNTTGDSYGASVIDILDPYETNKNTTIRALAGVTNSGGNWIQLSSGVYLNTESMTSFELFPEGGSWVTGSRFSLYGLKASV